MSSRPWRRVRALVAVAVLVVVLWQTGHAPFVAGLRALDLRLLALGAALAVPATIATAWRWQVVARALDVRVSLPGAVAACYAAQLVNSTLPGGVAGDVARGLRCAPAGNRLVGLRSVAWERLGGQAVQVTLAGGALLLLPTGVGVPWPTWVLVLVAAAVATGWASRARVVRQDLRRLAGRRVVAVVVASSLVAQTCYVATGVLAARAVGVTAPLAQLVPLVLLVLLAMAAPLGVAGWGPREGMAAWCFAAAGIGAGAGVATAVAYGVLVTVASLPGAVTLPVLARTATQTGARVAGGVHA